MANTRRVTITETYTQLNNNTDTYVIQNVSNFDIELVAVDSGTPSESSYGIILPKNRAVDANFMGVSTVFGRVVNGDTALAVVVE